jgi:guanylate kinase
VIVITGPSGAGKGTLIRALLERISELELAVSATTRLQRSGEEDGRDYYFLSDGEFATRVARGDFLEHVTYVSGQRYGTLNSEVDRIRSQGRSCVLELETQGAKDVESKRPETVSIFITAPIEELERRLRERATESAGEIGERVALARQQMEEAHEFDHVVVNDDLGQATERLAAIVSGEIGAPATLSRR